MVGKPFQVLFSAKARQDIDRITEYHELEVSRKNSLKARSGIIRAGLNLKNLPHSHPVLPGTEHRVPKARYTKFWSYKIIFSVFEEVDEVVILMIRHDKEDPGDILDNL